MGNSETQVEEQVEEQAADSSVVPSGQGDDGAGAEKSDPTLLGGEKKPDAASGTDAASESEGEGSTPEDPTSEGDYEAFSVPETVQVDDGVMADFSSLAKEMGLTQEQAQKFVDLQVRNAETMTESIRTKWTAVREGWVSDLTNDEEFGGDKFNDTVQRANRALSKYGDSALRELLNRSGYGDHPGLVKLLARVDAALGEDQAVDSNNAKEESTVVGLYPNNPQ